MSELSRQSLQRLLEDAEQHYSDEMPYHDWTHVLDVMGHADELADMAESVGNDLDRDALLLAAAWHDADYHLPLEGVGSREERSAVLARSRIMWHDIYLADDVASAIMDTKVDKSPKSSSLGIALHYADVGYLASPMYGKFFRRLDLMRQEWGAGEDEWDEVTERTCRFGRYVISEAREELIQILSLSDVERWTVRVEINLEDLENGRRR
jgi:hypothetical protein